MKTIYVPDYEWNSHYNSPEECVVLGRECGDFREGDEFKLVRLEVGARTTYRVVNGKPVPVALGFPAGISDEESGDGVGVPAYTHADVAAAHAEGYKLGLAQKDRSC